MNTKQQPYRPQCYEEYKALGWMISAESRDHGLAFQPKPTDIIITPYSKSGTTWLQQIVHALRTRGDMDFEDISGVVPWLEVAADLGQDLDAAQRAEPRAFKSHASWHAIPKGGRYIVSIRDPRDVLVSSFRFAEGWFFEAGAVTMTQFSDDFLVAGERSGYWYHLKSWWPQRHRENVLLLSFEKMKADLAGTINKVADFIGIALDDELRAIANHHGSFAFMKAHEDRFNDKLLREKGVEILNLPPDSDASKVRKGDVGDHRYELTPAIRSRLDQLWENEITGSTGLSIF